MKLRVLLTVGLLLLTLGPAAFPHPARAGLNVSITKSIDVPADAFIHNQGGHINNNHGNCAEGLRVDATSNNKARTLLRFDLSTQVPTGSTVSAATLTLNYYSYDTTTGYVDPVGRSYVADRITETDWVEGTACHANQTGSSSWNDRQRGTLVWTTAGGTYTTTNEATATVPAAFGPMTWTVTAQVQTAITDGIAAHFIILDPGANANARAFFRSRENAVNIPSLSITYTAPWDSYSDAAKTTVSDSFTGNGTIAYFKGTGFSTAQSYNIGYYDAGGTRRGDEGPLTAADLADTTAPPSRLLNANPAAAASPPPWNAVVYADPTAPPLTYTADGSRVADDQFSVDISAIPELPDVLAGIGVVALSGGIYFWVRRRKTSQESRVWSQESGVKSQGSRVWSRESGVRSRESRVRSQESRVKSPESGEQNGRF